MTTRLLTLLGSVGLIALALAAACKDTTAGQRGENNLGGEAGSSNADGGSKSSGGSGGGNASGGSENSGGGAGDSSGGGDSGGTGGDSGTGGASGGTGGAGTGGQPSIRPPFSDGFNCSAASGTMPALKTVPLASGLTQPVFMAPFPGSQNRFAVIEQAGLIKLVENGAVGPTPFLDLKSKTTHSTQDERGLLGIAFHPDYATNGLFYVYHTAASGLATGVALGDIVVAEYKVSSGSPDVADPGSMRLVLSVPHQQAANNNGGTIAFGGDGMLYVGLGDGGGQGDPYDNGQKLTTLLGKVLRIDVDGRGAGQYGIPPGNLVASEPNALPEIWDFGLRNPYRWSIDGCTGELYIADSGHTQQEEINVEAPQTGHKNYGWKTMEGTECYSPATGCAQTGITLPVSTYSTTEGAAVVGGYVYRGSIPALRGRYFYADYVQKKVRSLRWDGTQAQDVVDHSTDLGISQFPSSMAQDLAGEIYVITLDGVISRIDAE
jgi:glucose/arabinose dehydrogenase